MQLLPLAEGSWVLHCRCKHKHIDHDPVTLACRKPGGLQQVSMLVTFLLLLHLFTNHPIMRPSLARLQVWDL